MGFGAKTGQMARFGVMFFENEKHPQPEFSGTFSGDAYGKEAHPSHVPFSPCLPSLGAEEAAGAYDLQGPGHYDAQGPGQFDAGGRQGPGPSDAQYPLTFGGGR